jgi:hypothetical protein
MDQELFYIFLAGIIFAIGYAVGVWRTVSKIVDLVQESVEETRSLVPCVLSIEKIDNQFYAYADSKFIHQDTSFKPLVIGILSHAHTKSLKFTNTVVTSLSEAEVSALLETVMAMNNQPATTHGS